MKIYNEIIIDMNPESTSYMEVTQEDSFHYDGDLIHCLSREEMKERWRSGIADINGDGIANMIDIGLAGEFAIEEGKDPMESASSIANIVVNQEKWEADAPQTQNVPSTTTNALPSLPSVSNVGSVPFTGKISSIPGGFQPLPQTIGRNKKLYQLSQFHGGVNRKSSNRDISDNECLDATNITFSNIGSMKMLGDIKGTDNNITVTADDALAGSDMGATGYGLFQFTAPADHNGGNKGRYVLTLTADGNEVDVHDSDANAQGTWMTLGTHDNNAVSQIYYASGNGVYATDANFDNTNNGTRAKVWVYREDAGTSQTVSGWKEGKPLIDSPTYDSDAHGSMAAGTVKCVARSDDSEHLATVSSTLVTECDPNGTGNWNGTYYFYISWLFDGGTETGLTSFAEDSNSNNQSSDGITFTDNKLELNISLKHTPHASNNTELGADKRIEGGRIYFNISGGNERYLLAEFNLIDGVKGALDSTFIPWTENDDVYSHDTIIFTSPPEVYTYSSLNGYYANEVYSESKTILASTNAGPTAHDLRYKTCVVGQQGVVFIGNVRFQGKHKPDAMMFSMPGKPGVFPKYNFFDSPSSDGSPITALAAFQDTILQFKENAMYVINVSNPSKFYAEASFRDCGVFNPCQVFTTAFGVIFANQFGCYIYDGSKVISLTDGKFNHSDWGISEGYSHGSGSDASSVPCVGYDPRSQNIIVLKSIGNNSTNTTGWVYNIVTQSWSGGHGLITNADDDRHTNFIITSGGYLSIKRQNVETLYNYKQGNNAQIFSYKSKDLDFGLPNNTKKLFKVYITYKGNATNLTVTWRYNGEGTDRAFTATNFGNDSGTDDYEVASFVPDDVAQSKDWKSMIIHIDSGSSTVAADFEINDISILYRVRPIK
tara:strand:- start:802 stop:3459 length:2658 start_codon:yes stop_codon:yes gene_type:complete